MKRVFSGILVTGCVWIAPFSPLRLLAPAVAQTQAKEELFYTYYGKRIPLNLRRDAIAVAFKEDRTRGGEPLHLRLRQDLRGSNIRSPVLNVELQPLGRRYALIKLPSGTRSSSSAVQQQAKQQPYVESTLPVVTRSDRDEFMVVPNEIVVSFEPTLSESQSQAILKRQNLKVIRPLRFSRNRYLVKSGSAASGTAILGITNQLNTVKGVKSATPNFIQSLSQEIPEATQNNLPVSKTPEIAGQLTKIRAVPSARQVFQTILLPLEWHLNSTPLTTCLTAGTSQAESLWTCLTNPSVQSQASQGRTDIRATEAWQETSGGRKVLVAVLDSLNQWDHPDLAGNVYAVGSVKNKLPGEVHGWDFADNDSDTRISQAELARHRPSFQDTFQLSDVELLQQYPESAESIQRANPDYSREQIARVVRNSIRMESAVLFHGTWVSGVVAARPNGEQGVVGVAPNAEILPVCVGKEGPSTEAIVEGIGYAAARGADVINMSFSVPVEDVADQILAVQKAKPNLVFVAAAGNESLAEVSFPAAMSGVISVGATDFTGNRALYSSFGSGLDVVAPGGDVLSEGLGAVGGILTTGGTWVEGFWQGVQKPSDWDTSLDLQGRYMWVNGTSFSSPAVVGVVALMQGEDPNRQLKRDRLIEILKQTASYQGLTVSKEELEFYSLQRNEGTLPASVSPQQYFFGSGLVNAEAAVKEVRQSR